jgi:hypothetical protein
MTIELLTQLIFAAGLVELCIPVASVLVPLRLDWRREFQPLSTLHRQLYWVYGCYTLLSIIAIGAIALLNAEELAQGSMLARSFCIYGFAFWGVRLALQAVLDVHEHLSCWWLRLGYHALTVAFVYLTLVFAWAAFRPGG